MLLRFLWLSLLVQLATTSWAKQSSALNLSPSLAEFSQICRFHRQGAAEFHIAEAPAKDEFVPLAALEASSGSRLSQVLLLDRPIPVAELRVEQIIESHISQYGCASLLARSF